MPELDLLLDTLVTDVSAATRAPGAPTAIRRARRRRTTTAVAATGAVVVVALSGGLIAGTLAGGQRPSPIDRPTTPPPVSPTAREVVDASPNTRQEFGADLEALFADVPDWTIADPPPDDYDYAFNGPCSKDWAGNAMSGSDGGAPAPGPVGTRALPIGLGHYGYETDANASDAAARFAANLRSCTATTWRVRPIARTGAVLASSATGVAWIQQTSNHVDVLQVPTTDGPPPVDVQVDVAGWLVSFRSWEAGQNH